MVETNGEINIMNNYAFTYFKTEWNDYFVIGMNPFIDETIKSFKFNTKDEAINFCRRMNYKVNKHYKKIYK